MMVTVPDAPLAFDRAGSGEALVLVHPLGGDRGVWSPVFDCLARSFDTVAVDMPGFGESAELAPHLGASATELAAAIVDTLDALEIERAHVAGISLGGWVALEFAKTGRALSALGIAPAGFWPRPLGDRPEVARRLSRLIAPAAPALMHSERARRRALAGVVAHPERVPPAAAARLVRAYADARGFVRANSAMRRSLFEGFEDIPVPVTLAWCERDRLVAPPRSLPSHVRSLVLRDCGHIPTWDDPDQVVAAILASARSGQPAPAEA